MAYKTFLWFLFQSACRPDLAAQLAVVRRMLATTQEVFQAVPPLIPGCYPVTTRLIGSGWGPEELQTLASIGRDPRGGISHQALCYVTSGHRLVLGSGSHVGPQVDGRADIKRRQSLESYLSSEIPSSSEEDSSADDETSILLPSGGIRVASRLNPLAAEFLPRATLRETWSLEETSYASPVLYSERTTNHQIHHQEETEHLRLPLSTPFDGSDPRGTRLHRKQDEEEIQNQRMSSASPVTYSERPKNDATHATSSQDQEQSHQGQHVLHQGQGSSRQCQETSHQDRSSQGRKTSRQGERMCPGLSISHQGHETSGQGQEGPFQGEGQVRDVHGLLKAIVTEVVAAVDQQSRTPGKSPQPSQGTRGRQLLWTISPRPRK